MSVPRTLLAKLVRVAFGQARGQRSEPPMHALRTFAAMGALARFSYMRAADAMLDQICLPVLVDDSYHLGLCEPDERVCNLETMTEHMMSESRHARQHERMSRSRGTAADDLRNDRQVEAHDAILEEADPSAAQHLCDDASNGKEKEGSRPLRVFSVMQPFGQGDFDRDVQNSAREADAKRFCEIPLTAKDPIR
jgi:hypothetical protein